VSPAKREDGITAGRWELIAVIRSPITIAMNRASASVFAVAAVAAAVMLIAARFAVADEAQVSYRGVAWGQPVGGLRLGLSLDGNAPNGFVRVYFNNISSRDLRVSMGSQTGIDYDFEGLRFTVTRRNSEDHCNLLYPKAGLSAGGVVFGWNVPLSPTATYEFSEPISSFRCFQQRSSLRELLRQGFSLQAFFDRQLPPPQYASTPVAPYWFGKVSSGSIFLGAGK
jgi:hypothetical protein